MAVNNTEGASCVVGSDVDDAAITKSGNKNNPCNKVYPATDCEDKNFSQRIGPMSEDE